METIDAEFSSDLDDEKPKSSRNKSTNTKAIEGGLSMETFTTLNHTLRDTVDCAKCLLDEKGLSCVLPGKINNDPAEMHFCKMRSMSGMNAALSAELFCQNSLSVLLRDAASLSKNDDSAFNRMQCKLFFNDLTEGTKLCEKGISDNLKAKLSTLNSFSNKDKSRIFQNEILPCISGYCVKKLVKNHLKGCEKCSSFFTCGKCVTEDEMLLLECNTLLKNISDQGGLMQPKNNANTLCGIIITAFSNLSNNFQLMCYFNESAASS